MSSTRFPPTLTYEGQMTLINGGTIIASGINALVIDTGLNIIINSGMEAGMQAAMDLLEEVAAGLKAK